MLQSQGKEPGRTQQTVFVSLSGQGRVDAVAGQDHESTGYGIGHDFALQGGMVELGGRRAMCASLNF